MSGSHAPAPPPPSLASLYEELSSFIAPSACKADLHAAGVCGGDLGAHGETLLGFQFGGPLRTESAAHVL